MTRGRTALGTVTSWPRSTPWQTGLGTVGNRAVNLSLGADEHYAASACADAPEGGRNPYIASFDTLRELGVLPVVSAGNDAAVSGSFRSGISYPACTDNAVSVGAVYDFSGTYRGSCTGSAVPDGVACFSQSAANLTCSRPARGSPPRG